MGIFESKESKVARLSAQLREANTTILSLREVILDNDNKNAASKLSHREEISYVKRQTAEEVAGIRLEAEQQVKDVLSDTGVEIADLNRKIEGFENDFESKLEKAVKDEKKSLTNTEKALKKDYETKTKRLEADFASKTKKLEADFAAKAKQQTKEHLEKLSKMDTKLENDKASYRKYVRQENNKNIESLEKRIVGLDAENKRISIENGKLIGENTSLKSLSNFNAGKTESMGTLANKLTEGLVKAMPTVNADFTTPEVVVQMPKSETPTQKGGNNGGGNNEQKK